MKRPINRREELPRFIVGRGCIMIPIRRPIPRPMPMFPFPIPFKEINGQQRKKKKPDRPVPVYIQNIEDEEDFPFFPNLPDRKRR